MPHLYLVNILALMKFIPGKIDGVFLIDAEPIRDERGFFSRSFGAKEFTEQGLLPVGSESNISFNELKGTLRGMHLQIEPRAQAKLVRCTRGAIFDVLVDLRPQSKTFCKWESFELNQDETTLLYVPHGIAHGFQTLQDKTEVFYQVSAPFSPTEYRGVRWNDPAFSIKWPLPVTTMAPRDNQYPDFK